MYNAEQSYELILLMLCIWREARGESMDAKHAVGWCIRNRVMKPGKTWWGDDWETVILKPWQFSSFNPNDPNATKFPLPGDPSFSECLLAAKHVYDATFPDQTLGSTSYHDTSIAPPFWAAVMDKTVQIGRLIFYKEK
jgi:N-acetylmuramoyl-L-alanine amidase